MPIYKRELKAYFQSASTYVVLALFFFFVGFFFQRFLADFHVEVADAIKRGRPDQMPNLTHDLIPALFRLINMVAMFSVPVLAMRLMAEEKSSGTFEVLATCPVSDSAIVVGKFLALSTVGLVMTVISLIYPLTLAILGRTTQVAPEWPVVAVAWLGLLLIYGAYAAFGLMASSFSANQVTASVVTLIGLLLWHSLHFIPLAGMPRLQGVIDKLSAAPHIESLTDGVLIVNDFIFFALATFFFLFVAVRSLDARRWRV